MLPPRTTEDFSVCRSSPDMILYFIFQQSARLIADLPRSVCSSRRRIADGESLPDQRPRLQPPVLGTFRKLYGLASRLKGEMGHPRGIFDAFLELGVLHHAFEQAGARHQNEILLFVAERISLARFFGGSEKIAAVEVQVPAVDADRTGTAVV